MCKVYKVLNKTQNNQINWDRFQGIIICDNTILKVQVLSVQNGRQCFIFRGSDKIRFCPSFIGSKLNRKCLLKVEILD